MKLKDKMWFRVLVVITAPVWIIAAIPLFIIVTPIIWIGFGVYTYIKDGRFEEL